MISILVIAGNKSKNLSKFLQDRGTFDVNCYYPSFKAGEDDIKNKIIRVDKTLYLFNPDDDHNLSILEDMQALKSLLTGNAFFNPGEIIFVGRDNEVTKDALRYFMTVINDCSKKNYSIKTVDGEMTYTEIYSALVGVSVPQKFHNSYNKLYRVERNSDAKVAYDGTDDHDMRVEPFQLDRLKEYDNNKKDSIKLDSGNVIQDKNNQITKFDNLNLPILTIEPISKKQSVYLISGEKKTGTSVWASVLAYSAVSAGKRTLLFDFTDNSDIDGLLKLKDVPHNTVSMLSLLKSVQLDRNILSVCSVGNSKEFDVRLDFLQNFFARDTSFADAIFIAVSSGSQESVLNLLHQKITSVCITAHPIRQELLFISKLVTNLDLKVKIILNDNLKLISGMSYLDANEIKKIFKDKIRVVKPHIFNSITVDASLYQMFEEV